MRAAKADLKDAVDQLVRRRREAGATSTDVLSLLLADQAGGDGPSDADIVGECIGFLFAGHETTASTLTWALYELATHPDIQAEVAAEGARSGDRYAQNGAAGDLYAPLPSTAFRQRP